MASRVGSYLSDENIRKMCPLEHMPPGSKTYELFKIASAPDALAQRPQDPKQALRRIALYLRKVKQHITVQVVDLINLLQYKRLLVVLF